MFDVYLFEVLIPQFHGCPDRPNPDRLKKISDQNIRSSYTMSSSMPHVLMVNVMPPQHVLQGQEDVALHFCPRRNATYFYLIKKIALSSYGFPLFIILLCYVLLQWSSLAPPRSFFTCRPIARCWLSNGR